MDWKNQTILITGGTGSFGKKFTKIALEEKRALHLENASPHAKLVVSVTTGIQPLAVL